MAEPVEATGATAGPGPFDKLSDLGRAANGSTVSDPGCRAPAPA
ncbi:hypothetical protein RWH43_02055 [Microbacterium sp. KSW2-21]|uniref:Uncharacterized protein n=1 Tax=Microbacterium algihabitans TaxID=3075992 RepID=A0ABU3RRK5_9MICO|nr:hypothetical protein [Microbacterium sp. KSW2-21]MDU0325530.1 hypothetical protein [Microbacterium sp. KSW2-21]